MDEYGIVNHENIGTQFLEKIGFPESVLSPIREHVNAKKYLVYKDESYNDLLSPTAKKTLIHQGGAMTQKEAITFEKKLYFNDCINLRKWEEEAKDPNYTLPKLDKYIQMCLNILK